jgi:hypothetical protein
MPDITTESEAVAAHINTGVSAMTKVNAVRLFVDMDDTGKATITSEVGINGVLHKVSVFDMTHPTKGDVRTFAGRALAQALHYCECHSRVPSFQQRANEALDLIAGAGRHMECSLYESPDVQAFLATLDAVLKGEADG